MFPDWFRQLLYMVGLVAMVSILWVVAECRNTIGQSSRGWTPSPPGAQNAASNDVPQSPAR